LVWRLGGGANKNAERSDFSLKKKELGKVSVSVKVVWKKRGQIGLKITLPYSQKYYTFEK
jgi:hypothetical protein